MIIFPNRENVYCALKGEKIGDEIDNLDDLITGAGKETRARRELQTVQSAVV